MSAARPPQDAGTRAGDGCAIGSARPAGNAHAGPPDGEDRPASPLSAPALAPFAPLWREHAPHVAPALLPPPARQAFDALAPHAPAGAAAFALECGLTPGVRPHLYLALHDARAKQAAGHGHAPGLLYLRYTLNGAGRASVPLPHLPGPSRRQDWPGWLDTLARQGMPAGTATQARAWLDKLPDGAAIDNAAWLDRRPGQPLRLYVSGLPQPVPHGLPGAPPALPEQAATPAALASRRVAIVDLDEAGPRPRWGLELLAERHPDGALARWRPMIETLVAQGLCTPAGRQALAQWCGQGGNILRSISHMKLLLEGGKVRDARAFLLAKPPAA